MKLKYACIKAVARRRSISVACNSRELQTHEAVFRLAVLICLRYVYRARPMCNLLWSVAFVDHNHHENDHVMMMIMI